MFGSQSWATVKECRSLLLDEIKNIMAQDEGFLNAQMQLTTMKMAGKVFKRKGLNAQTIEAYTKSIVGPKTTQKVLNQDDIRKRIMDLYNKYSTKKELAITPSLDSLINSKKPLNDADVSRLMIILQESDGNFDLNQMDYAIAWLSNKISQASNKENSFLISNTIKKMLSESSSPQTSIAKSIIDNQLKLKNYFIQIRAKVFKEHQDKCLNLYVKGADKKAQAESVFAACGVDEMTLLDKLFIEALEDIHNHVKEYPRKNRMLASVPDLKVKKVLNDNEAKALQDNINQHKTDRERIIAFHKSDLAPKTSCQGYVMMDKLTNQMSLYTNDGQEIISVKGLTGKGVYKDKYSFHSDSALRGFPRLRDGEVVINPKTGNPMLNYSGTTGAGLYYSIKLKPEERTQRMHDQEFNNRVLPLSLKVHNKNKNGYVLNEKIPQAIHGVPNKEWVGNKEKRMTSLQDKGPMNLSAGCVNLAGYSYDLMEEFLHSEEGEKCPVYILPEDKTNYFFVKNREMNFSTSDLAKKKGKDVAFTIDDQTVTNRFNYTPLNLTRNHKAYKIKGGDKSAVIDYLLSPEVQNELYKRAKDLESDKFEDYAKLAHLMTDDEAKAKQIFLNLYNSHWRLVNKEGKNLDFLTHEKQIEMIIKKYNEDFDSSEAPKSLYDKMQQVEFSKVTTP